MISAMFSSLRYRLLFCILYVGIVACAPVKITYFKPIGDGLLVGGGSCNGPRETISYPLLNGSMLYSSAHQLDGEDGVSIRVAFLLRPDTYVRLVDKKVLLKINGAKEYVDFDIEKIEGMKWDGEKFIHWSYNPDDLLVADQVLKTKFVDSFHEYWFRIEYKGETPVTMEVITPEIVVNDKRNRGEYIKYELNDSVYLQALFCP